ncbi:MAG: hypothetical protein K1W03_08950, partial [Mailhella sp.]
ILNRPYAILLCCVGSDMFIRDRYTYGWPYYGGWGLTHDAAQYSLRNRKLNFEQILAGAFITQPRYFDSENNIYCESENAPFLFGH